MTRRLAFALSFSTLLVGAVAGSSGCSAGRPAVPGSSDHPWRELRSTHFILETDQDEAEATKAIAAMEGLQAVLSNVLFPGPDASLDVRVIGFRSQGEFESFAARGAQAYAAYGLPFSPSYQPTIVYYGEMLQAQRRVLAHELTHALVGRRFPGTPVWLNEGFAEYAETVDITGGAAYFGRSPADGRQWLGQWMPSLVALRHMKRSEFYAKREGTKHELERDEAIAVASHYGAAWGAVHMFITGERRYAEAFAEYVKDLSLGVRDEDAWTKAFKGISDDELQQAFERHLARKFGVTWKTPYDDAPYDGPVAVHAMSPGEVLVLQAELAAGQHQDKRAADLVRSATDVDPRSARAWWARGLITTGPEGVSCLRKAEALEPANADVLHALFLAEERKRPQGMPPSEEEARLFDALAKNASTATQLNTVAWVKAHGGKTAAALAYAKKSVTLAPMCAACVDTLAFVAHEKGDLPAAIELQRRAVRLLGEGRNDPAYEKTLREYEEEHRQKGGVATGAAP